METTQKNITLGTAGHIDHGKTALIKCLTGCDTDTLKAEKERGMSIDLGFAPCTISNLEIGIVDVPGHENFVKTMVAGASGIDGVIFVIAADDGVMPQTREHLDILTLLAVTHGITVLTKTDCVDSERLRVVTDEVKNFLVGTFLENAPIIPFSSITGHGFEQLYEELKNLVNSIKPKTTDGVFRLPVERAFSLKGYGTVVTGIPVSGSIKIGDEAILLPQQTKGRIKTIQVYKRNSDTAISGQCAAINVSRWDYKKIRRGNVITLSGYFSPQSWYLCCIRLLESNKYGLKNGAQIKFHTGTSEVHATVYLMESNILAAGQRSIIQVKLNEPLIAGPADRFILRTSAPVRTIGGGMIIEAIPKKLKRSHPDILLDVQARAKVITIPKNFVEYCIKTAENQAANVTSLSKRTKLLPEQLNKILSELTGQAKVLRLGAKLYIHSDIADNAQRKLLDIAAEYHQNNPESPGITTQQLSKASSLQKDVFEGMLDLLTSNTKLVERKHRFALPEHQENFSDSEQKLLDSIESLFRKQLFNPPSRDNLIEQTAATPDMVQKILRILTEQERLVRIDVNLLFHCQAVEQAQQIITSYIAKEGRLESVKFKYLLDTTRKFAIPLLDYFDRIGVTRRADNTRYLKKPL